MALSGSAPPQCWPGHPAGLHGTGDAHLATPARAPAVPRHTGAALHRPPCSSGAQQLYPPHRIGRLSARRTFLAQGARFFLNTYACLRDAQKPTRPLRPVANDWLRLQWG